MRRRTFLAASAAGLTGLAGCGSNDGGESGDGGRSADCPAYDPTVEGSPGWTTRGGGVANTGVVPAGEAPGESLSVDWAATLGGHSGTTTPAVAEGTAYTSDLDERVVAVETATGDVLWEGALPGVRGSPAVGGGVVVFLTGRGAVALDAATGDRRWRALDRSASLFGGSPVVADGVAYVPLGLSLHALDLSDGSVRWSHTTGLESRATPSVVDGSAYAGDDDTYVHALDAATGERRWRAKTDGRVRSEVPVAGGTVYATSEAGTVHAFDAETGAERWRRSLDGRARTLATDGAHLYVPVRGMSETAFSGLVALHAGDGTPCWRAAGVATSHDGAVAIGDGRVFVTSSSGVRVYDAATGERVGGGGEDRDRTTRLDEGPAVAGGAAYATGFYDGTLSLVRLS